jgi:predicted ATP-grasp superfamily ATP-dependent carboligase
MDQAMYTTPAVVLDGSINGLGILRSLSHDAQVHVILVGAEKCPASYSKHKNEFRIANTPAELVAVLKDINNKFPSVVVYPCSDKNYAVLIDNKASLPNFVIPWDEDGKQLMSKEYQLNVCEKAGVTYPKSFVATSVDDFDTNKPKGLTAPYILKPDSAGQFKNANGDLIFKVREAHTEDEARELVRLGEGAGSGVLISELVTGPEKNLITYGGYAHQGKVVTHYTGYKLHNTYPTRVVAIACGMDIPDAHPAGEAIVKAYNHTGLFQLELKRHDINGKLYYIEFNPRNWLWGYLATAEGNNMPLAKFYTESGMPEKWIAPDPRNPDLKSYYIWEFGSLTSIVGYKTLGPIIDTIKVLFSRKKKAVFALLDFSDIKPLYGFIRHVLKK